MVRALLCLFCLFLAGCSGDGSPAPTPGPTPAGVTAYAQVYTNSTLVSPSDVQGWCSDHDLQFSRDVSPRPIWGVNATFTLVGTVPTTWPAIIVQDASPDGNQGEHDNVTAWVFVAASVSQNGTPEATFGKEALELILQRAVTGPVAPYAYPVGGVNATGPAVLHDFLFPTWWTGVSAPYDQMGICTGPGEIAPGGLDD